MRAQEKRTSSVSDNRYAKLEADMEKQNQNFIDTNKHKQEQIMQAQDNQLEAISKGIVFAFVYSTRPKVFEQTELCATCATSGSW